MQRLPYNFAKMHGVCLQAQEGGLLLLHLSGLKPPIYAEVLRFANAAFTLKELDSFAFEKALSQVYTHDTGAAQRFANDAGEAFSLENAMNSIAQADDLLAQEDDAPIIRLINALLMEALRDNASDIHFETFEKSLIVRFRIDGVLQEAVTLQPALAPLLVSRIKVMAKLDIAEKRLPQDGRISLRIGEREVDVRVSTMPTGNAERVVLRLLDRQARST